MSDEDMAVAVHGATAGFLGWLVPGLGHLYLGHRARGIIFLATITVTFWTGVAIGGVHHTVDREERKLWFVAQLLTGGNTAAALAVQRVAGRNLPADRGRPLPAHWASVDLGVHYTGIAGLLNLLVILDAIGRAEAGRGTRPRRAGPAFGP